MPDQDALVEAEIPVCAPLAFPSGETLHEVEEIRYAVWPRTGGRAAEAKTCCSGSHTR